MLGMFIVMLDAPPIMFPDAPSIGFMEDMPMGLGFEW